MKRLSLIPIVAMVLAIGLPVAASAHPTSDFSACAGYRRVGGICQTNTTYYYGQTVHLRGHVRPAHSSLQALVVMKRPNQSRWRVVDEVAISDRGNMRWSWHTTIDDAVQDRPYGFRLRIPNHGISNNVVAWIIFGE